MNIVLLCGGKGTRLSSISGGKPKALIPINSKPFIYLLLDSLVNNGFKKIYLLISFKSDDIKNELGLFYKSIPIVYIEDNKKLKPGTASALLNAIDYLPEHFLLQYGDTILNIDYQDFYNNSKNLKTGMLMSIFDNKNNLDKNNVFYKNNKLIYFNSESKNNIEKIKSSNFIDYGLLGIQKSFLMENLEILKTNECLKFFQESLSYLNLIKPYLVNKRFYEIGTPQSYMDFKNSYSKNELQEIINFENNN